MPRTRSTTDLTDKSFADLSLPTSRKKDIVPCPKFPPATYLQRSPLSSTDDEAQPSKFPLRQKSRQSVTIAQPSTSSTHAMDDERESEIRQKLIDSALQQFMTNQQLQIELPQPGTLPATSTPNLTIKAEDTAINERTAQEIIYCHAIGDSTDLPNNKIASGSQLPPPVTQQPPSNNDNVQAMHNNRNLASGSANIPVTNNTQNNSNNKYC